MAGNVTRCLLLGPLAVAERVRSRGVGAVLMWRALREAKGADTARCCWSAIPLIITALASRRSTPRTLRMPGPYDFDRLLRMRIRAGRAQARARHDRGRSPAAVAAGRDHEWHDLRRVGDHAAANQFAVGLRRRRRCLARGDENAGQHQRKADEMEQPRPFAEKDHRHHGAEQRHQMKERRGAVGADQLDAAIEAEIGQRRGKHRDIEQRQQVRGVQRHHRTRRPVPRSTAGSGRPRRSRR